MRRMLAALAGPCYTRRDARSHARMTRTAAVRVAQQSRRTNERLVERTPGSPFPTPHGRFHLRTERSAPFYGTRCDTTVQPFRTPLDALCFVLFRSFFHRDCTYDFCGKNVFTRHFFVDALCHRGRQDSTARIALGSHWNWQGVPCTRRWTYS